MSNPAFTIRRACSDDGARLCDLVLGLMDHLGDDRAHFAPQRFLDDAFGEEPQFAVLVAECAGDLIGYALFFDSYEPAFTARGVYLSDLFVAAKARRGGVGRALIAAVAADAQRRNRSFVWWVARGDDARQFYRTFADVEQQTTAHAITFETFKRLAGEARG